MGKGIYSFNFIFSVLFCIVMTNAGLSQITANFSGSPVAGCTPLVVQFADTSKGSPTSWNWDFGNSSTSTIQNPGTIYSLPGKYSVTLTISNGTNTNTIVKSNYITVYNKPTASFTLSSDTACVGNTVTFTDATVISIGGAAIATWLWDFGDGNTAAVTTTSINHTYTSPGNYPVSLIVTDIHGCTGSIIQKIVIVPMPTVAFTATTLFACIPPLNVTFTNTSASVGHTTYSWDFGDGNNSAAANPIHTYTAIGTYRVKLIVNQKGCIDSLIKQNYIIIQNMVANFIATPTVVCTGQPITFNTTSLPNPTTENWSFGDGETSNTANPSHTYTASGTYLVALTSVLASSNGSCSNTTTQQIVVNQTPVANFTANATTACSAPYSVNFSNTSVGGTNFVWNFGDGSPISSIQNPTHVYTTSGIFSVSLIAMNANGLCTDTIVKNNFISIFPPIASFIKSPSNGCAPITTNFLSTSTSLNNPITSYIWDFGDGYKDTVAVPGTAYTYTAVGIYTVSLIIHTLGGCIDTFKCINCVRTGVKPSAGFGMITDTVCFGSSIPFFDSSTGHATGWHWNFGNGDTSTLQNPIYDYTQPGVFNVFLIADNEGCPDTSVKKQVVILAPRAIISFTMSCTNNKTVSFSSISVGADSLVWNFGDGTMDITNNNYPTHIYLTRGTYKVSLTAYNYSTKCSDSMTGIIIITQPIASFSVSNSIGCTPFLTNFISTSQDVNYYEWIFDDPSSASDTSIVQNPGHTFYAPGQYIVSLTISDVNGCKRQVKDTVIAVGPKPYFYANKNKGCGPLLVTFKDTSVSDSSLALVQRIWNFGDGSPPETTTSDSITHIYNSPKTFTVTMTVKDSKGCYGTLVKNGYIKTTFPLPSFTVEPYACKNDIINFNASSTNTDGGIYIWNFGDGNIDSTHNPIVTHSYTTDNGYTVTLTVKDTNSCTNAITKNIQIRKPNAFFRDSILHVGCGTIQVSFIDTSKGFVNSWYWDFGDGANSTLQNPFHTYTQPGIYNVSLVVTNLGGCKDTIKRDSIIEVPSPIGSFVFAATSGCNPLNVCFHETSIHTQSYIWDFGDGTVVHTLGDTCHVYTTAGNFNPVLLLQNTLPGGSPCLLPATNITGSVTITNLINVSLNSPHVIHLPIDSTLAITATFSGGLQPYTYHWNQPTGLNCDSCSSVIILGMGDTTMYTFTIYDAYGCIGKDSILIQSEACFQKKRIPDIFSPNGDGVNDLFYIPGVCPNENYLLEIFDRWGVLMFATDQRNHGWDGRTNAGLEAEEGVYYFAVKLSGQVNQKAQPINDSTYKGFVHLVR